MINLQNRKAKYNYDSLATAHCSALGTHCIPIVVEKRSMESPKCTVGVRLVFML